MTNPIYSISYKFIYIFLPGEFYKDMNLSCSIKTRNSTCQMEINVRCKDLKLMLEKNPPNSNLRLL